MRAVFIWWSPRAPSPTQWGYARILFSIMTLLHHFRVQFSSDDPQGPHAPLGEDSQGSFSPFWHFFTPFQSRSYMTIPKIRSPIKWGSSRILFTVLTLFCLFFFFLQFLTDDPHDPQVHPCEDPHE
jgi:hypothetical protein